MIGFIITQISVVMYACTRSEEYSLDQIAGNTGIQTTQIYILTGEKLLPAALLVTSHMRDKLIMIGVETPRVYSYRFVCHHPGIRHIDCSAPSDRKGGFDDQRIIDHVIPKH